MTQILSVLHTYQHLSLRGPIAAELVCDDQVRDVLAAPEQLVEELLGRGFLPAALHQNLQHVAFLVDRPPQLVRLLVDLEEDFIQVPLVARSRTALT